MKDLAEKKSALEMINKKIKNLEDLYNEKIAFKERLEAEIKECELKLDMAQRLTTGLSEEQIRWKVDIGELEKKEPLMAGDSVIATGMVAYGGPFTSKFRQELEKAWVTELDKLSILHSKGVSMK